jgi:hypothetical protein
VAHGVSSVPIRTSSISPASSTTSDIGILVAQPRLTLGADEDRRDWIDGRLLCEMNRKCRDSFDAWWQRVNKEKCLSDAGWIWGAVRHRGRDAFYA